MLTRRQFIASSVASGLSSQVAMINAAMAQIIDKQATMIVGFAAGGGTDASARMFAQHLRGGYAPNVLIENKVGAASRIAVNYVKNAPPDGSVMLFTPDFPLTLYPHIFKKLTYDPLNDLIPVAPLTKSALVLCIGPAVPAEVTTLAGFLQWANDNPARASFATTGAGGTPHFTGVMLANASKAKLTPVHYRGGAPALQDLLGGHVAASINPSSEAIPQAAGGNLRMLAVTSAARSRFLPDVPTLRELGFNIALNAWTGVLLPAKTPPAIVAGLSAALEKAVKSPELVAAQARFGNEMTFQRQADFAASMKQDIDNWAPIVKASGFTATD